MDWNAVSIAITASAALSTLMGFVFALMIRASIAEMSNSITAEIHKLLDDKYVLKEIHERDMAELRQGVEWLESLIGRK